LGSQWYVLHIDSAGVTAAATGPAGLFYASETLAQIATDRTLLQACISGTGRRLRIAECKYDISRGQMPRLDTLSGSRGS